MQKNHKSIAVWALALSASALAACGSQPAGQNAGESATASSTTSAEIAGTWVEPIPIAQDAEQGMQLNADGTASSIGMATLQINSWKQPSSDLLVLSTVSIGNGVTCESEDTLKIVKLDADSLVLANTSTGFVTWRLGRQK